MSRVRVHGFTVSVDGFGAGPDQSLEHPIGVGGTELHQWMFPTRSFHRMVGEPGGETGPDDDLIVRGFDGIGAWILGRNMFGPVRGPWPDESWRGWWGEEPPYHTDVFVLTHHPRPSLSMAGGTTFHFVTGGPEEALRRARASAGERDVRVGGGVSTLRQYVQSGAVDEIHLAVSPIVLGRGERLFAGLDLARLGFRRREHVATARALHLLLERERT